MNALISDKCSLLVKNIEALANAEQNIWKKQKETQLVINNALSQFQATLDNLNIEIESLYKEKNDFYISYIISLKSGNRHNYIYYYDNYKSRNKMLLASIESRNRIIKKIKELNENHEKQVKTFLDLNATIARESQSLMARLI